MLSIARDSHFGRISDIALGQTEVGTCFELRWRFRPLGCDRPPCLIDWVFHMKWNWILLTLLLTSYSLESWLDSYVCHSAEVAGLPLMICNWAGGAPWTVSQESSQQPYEVCVLSLLYRGRNWGSERLGDLADHIQCVSKPDVSGHKAWAFCHSI